MKTMTRAIGRASMALALLAGCECGREAPPPATVTERSFESMLAAARAARDAHDYAGARAGFDAILPAPEATPAIRCEAGWATHLAGDDVAASVLFDQALVALDHGAHGPALANALASCLDLRGQLFEANASPYDAWATYMASLSAVPDEAVRARQDAVAARLSDAGTIEHTLAGIPFEDERVEWAIDAPEIATLLLQTTNVADLERALVAGWRRASFVGRGTATQRAQLTLAGPRASRALVYTLEGGGDIAEPTGVLAVLTTRGFELFALPAEIAASARLSPSGAGLRIDGAAPLHRSWFHDGVFRDDTVCFADCTYDTTFAATCDGSPMLCWGRTLSMRPHDVARAPIRCHAIADGALVEGAPDATPTVLPDGDWEVTVQAHVLTDDGTASRGTPPPADIHSLDVPTLCADHDWCAMLDDIASTPDVAPPWQAEGMPETAVFVPGTSPPLAFTHGPAVDSLSQPTFLGHLEYWAPYRGAWRSLARVEVDHPGSDMDLLLLGVLGADGALADVLSGDDPRRPITLERIAPGAVEHVDLLPGDPLELRIPLRWTSGDDAADSVVVCALLDGVLSCRASPRAPYASPPAPAGIAFDGHGHVTVAPRAGAEAREQDLATWIRSGSAPR